VLTPTPCLIMTLAMTMLEENPKAEASTRPTPIHGRLFPGSA